MTDTPLIRGRMAALRIENLDTDQIMPKQFLHGVDKSGLATGLLHDLRFDAQGRPRPGNPLEPREGEPVRVLVGGANFGCGSSREHAVWGLQQFGIEAVIAPSYGEIFFANAMNNGLLLVTLPALDVAELMDLADAPGGTAARIDLRAMTVHGEALARPFSLSARHRRMLLEGLDTIGLSLASQPRIDAFAAAHWAAQPWLRDVARRTRERLAAEAPPPAPPPGPG